MEISKELVNSIYKERKWLNCNYSAADIESMTKLILVYLFDFKNVTNYSNFRDELSLLLIRVERRHNGIIMLNDLAETENLAENTLYKELMSNSRNFDENLLCFVGNSLLVREPTIYIAKNAFFNSQGEKNEIF